MKKLFCMADIHGHWMLAYDALENAGFDIDNPDHIFIHCGDLLDRGPDNYKCLELVNSIPKDRRVLIWGNHEELLEEACARTHFLSHDYYNGTIKTVSDLSHFSYEDVYRYDLTAQAAMIQAMTDPEWLEYKNSCYDFAIIGQYVFVHAWIPTHFYDGTNVTSLDRVNGDWKDGNWKKARWLNGMEEWAKGNRMMDRTIVCGHWHASWGHAYLHNNGVEFEDYYEGDNKDNPNAIAHFEPFIDDGIIALDACTIHSKKVNCKILEVTDEEWAMKEMR